MKAEMEEADIILVCKLALGPEGWQKLMDWVHFLGHILCKIFTFPYYAGG